jgi:hypothetical protein
MVKAGGMKIVHFAITHSGEIVTLCDDGHLYQRIPDRRSFAGPSGQTVYQWQRIEGPSPDNIVPKA